MTKAISIKCAAMAAACGIALAAFLFLPTLAKAQAVETGQGAHTKGTKATAVGILAHACAAVFFAG